MNLWNKKVGKGESALIIAEAGVNHNGDMDLAKQLIEIAAKAGADAVKFQTLDASSYISRYAPKANYQAKHTDGQESQLDMVRKYELSRINQLELIEHCYKHNINFFSTAFDEGSVDLLEEIGVACFKIPSGEINNLPLLTHLAKKGKPVILSTGMSYLGEVEKALITLRENGAGDVGILHCVSNYPTLHKDLNLKAMCTMAEAFGLPTGLSDHTLGIEASIAAVAMGATIIEKHFTINRDMSGPDHQASLMPEELEYMVRAIRNVECGLGDGIKRPADSEKNTIDVARKSLVAAQSIAANTVITESLLLRKRPGTGISPDQIPFVVGRRAKRDIGEDEILTWEMLN